MFVFLCFGKMADELFSWNNPTSRLCGPVDSVLSFNCWPNLEMTSNGMEADRILIRLRIVKPITMEYRSNEEAAR